MEGYCWCTMLSNDWSELGRPPPHLVGDVENMKQRLGAYIVKGVEASLANVARSLDRAAPSSSLFTSTAHTRTILRATFFAPRKPDSEKARLG